MYSLFEYSSSYSDTTGSLWFYSLHEKPCFLSPGISWKAQKEQVNIIFPSTFWLKKRSYSHHLKVQNRNFSLTSKYDLSINFLPQKKTVFSTTEKFKNKNFSVISKYHLFHQLLDSKKTVIEKFQHEIFSNQ